jgi:hypothetical protein
MRTGAWLSAAGGCTLPWMARAANARNRIAVVDVNLVSGRAFADYVARLEMPVFEPGDDVGLLWHATLAPRLAAVQGSLIGFTRASDFFVLGQLAASSRRKVRQTSEPGAGLGSPVAFLIEPDQGGVTQFGHLTRPPDTAT